VVVVEEAECHCGSGTPLRLSFVLLLADIVAEALSVVAEGEDAEGALVVFGIDAVVVGGFEEVDL